MIYSYEENGKTLFRVTVVLRDKTGRQHARRKKGFLVEREAIKYELDAKNELSRIVTCLNCHTWKSWFDACMEQMKLNNKAATIVNYTSRIHRWVSPEWDSKLLTEITPSEVHRIIFKHIGDNLTGTGQETVWKLIRRIFQMAVDEGILPRNPAAPLKVRRDTQEGLVLTPVEGQKLLDESRAYNHPMWSVYAFALMTGMRSGEMYAIRWTDVDFTSDMLSVNKQWTNKDGICSPKSSSNRKIPISSDFKQFLIEWRGISPGFRKELFDSRLGELTTHGDYILPLDKDWTNGMQAEALRNFCKVIGITPIRFHDLRATFITNLLTRGVPLGKVMMIVGHRKLGTTDVYFRKAGVGIQGALEGVSFKAPSENVGANVVNFKPRHDQ